MGALPAAVQQGTDKGAAFWQVLREEALFQITSCLNEPNYDSSELVEWNAVIKSLAPGSIVEQGAATLLCTAAFMGGQCMSFPTLAWTTNRSSSTQVIPHKAWPTSCCALEEAVAYTKHLAVRHTLLTTA